MTKITGILTALCMLACRAEPPADPETDAGTAADPRGFEPPIVINAEAPVRYPPELFLQKAQGTVVLRLFVDESGMLIADSTRIAEGSGHSALDSAALAAVPDMRFAPARREGVPVATAFLQPVHFRHPEGAAPGGAF
ncbi:MAG TPA: TonB family protein [Gemmatimonadales bacterium]